MNEPTDPTSAFRDDLVEILRATRETERDVFGALDPTDRDGPPAAGGWSAKDVQAHLSAWRRRQVQRLAAIRDGRAEPADVLETDAVNAVFHAERAAWPWERVSDDADASASDLIEEVQLAAAATLEIDRISGSIMGNGPEHVLAHLPALAARSGLDHRVFELAGGLASTIDQGRWPARSAAYARYNLACFHALGGRLPAARSLLRKALVEQEALRAFAPEDADLVALRAEIPALLDG